MRSAGILYPIFSLSSKYGIGCFSKEAYGFIDFLKESGQTYWQILPIGPTGYGDSPYQPVSVFAGNPYFIDLEDLMEQGLISWDELNAFDFGNNEEEVDYGALYNNRFLALEIAYRRFDKQDAKYQNFVIGESYWLKDYALFMTLKKEFDGKSWLDWDPCFRKREKKALSTFEQKNKETIEFYYFQQYQFTRQWKNLQAYAKKRKVQIIGDIPFYCALDSADTWAHPELFLMDKEGKPEFVAGCLPDAFSKTGQLWGNPLYDWESMKKNHYVWWMQRMGRSQDLFDITRMDHFHGFASYCAIPYGEKTALNGKMKPGPGMNFFKQLSKEFPKMRIIAEDLGTSTLEKEKLLKDSGFPGMKILQFAYTGDHQSTYLPYKHNKNSVVYTGTHDNPTTNEWFESLNENDKKFVVAYTNSDMYNAGKFVWDFIREAYRSCSDTCIIPLQDFLVKGKEARINTPGVTGSNWKWRLKPNFLSHDLEKAIYDLSDVYGRLPKEDE